MSHSIIKTSRERLFSLRAFSHAGMLLLFGLSLGGCAATYLAITGSDLKVETRLTDTIFLDPVSEEKRTVYVTIRNTSGVDSFDITSNVKAELIEKGYRITKNPDRAYYWLQGNVRFVGETAKNAAEAVYESGFGSPVAAGLLTGLGANALGLDDRSSTAVGLAASVIAALVDWSVEDIHYAVITDLQISERLPKGATTRQRQKDYLSQGSSGVSVEKRRTETQRKRYRTRILSSAQKINLSLEEAGPPLREKLTSTIAGIF